MFKFTIAFVEEPTKDQLYILENRADFAVENKIISLVPKFDVIRSITGNWLVVFDIPVVDKMFWLGVLAGRDLGINIGKS